MMPADYIDLVLYYEPRPIKDEEDQEATHTVIDALLAIPERNQDQEDYLHILKLLMAEYKSEVGNG